tara:strand:- start:2835 stop:3608 length:774 start_codon:yes stop_codon:yes gene_type:complete
MNKIVKNKIFFDFNELSHYNKKYSSKKNKWNYDKIFISADKTFFDLIKKIINKKGICKILDLGCGDGSRTRLLSLNPNVYLVGIDISKNGIQKANKNKIGNAQYRIMDIEKLNFKINTFDLIIDYGSFSSFEMSTVWPLLKKIIKPRGIIIGIETLGDNPIFNMKRKFNIYRKLRTAKIKNNIITMNQLYLWGKDCNDFTFQTFGFISTIISPLVLLFDNSFINYCIRIADKFDKKIFMKFKIFQRLSFKVIFKYKF